MGKIRKSIIILILLFPIYLLFTVFFAEFDLWDWLEKKVKGTSHAENA